MSVLQKVMCGALIGSQFQFNCKRMNDALKFAESKGVTDYGFNGFEMQCWENSYWAEQYQMALSLIGKVFDSLERDELLQISGMASDFWYAPDTAEVQAFSSLKNSVNEMFEEWKRHIEREDYYYKIWRPWEGNVEVKKKIEEHKTKMESVRDNVIDFKSIVEQERYREQEQKQLLREQQEKEIIQRKQLEDEISRAEWQISNLSKKKRHLPFLEKSEIQKLMQKLQPSAKNVDMTHKNQSVLENKFYEA